MRLHALVVALALAVAAVMSGETCWKDAEGQDDGVTKACWYACVYGHEVRVIASSDRCPLSVRKGGK